MNSRKIQQMIGYFLDKNGGTIDLCTLLRLLNHANNVHMQQYDYPVLCDHVKSNGPVDTDEFSESEMDTLETTWNNCPRLPKHIVEALEEHKILDELFENSI